MKILTVKLDDRSANKIARIAKARKTTKSQVVREALELGLQNKNNDPLNDPLADIRDLIGSVDGPSDLSTNAKYLDGYGEDK